MKEDEQVFINPRQYEIRNKETGEISDMDIIVKKCNVSGWEKTYPKALANLIGCGGCTASVISYFIENKNTDNMIIGTYAQIAEKVGVSERTVANTIKALKKNRFLKQHSPSCYMLDPNVMRYGSQGKGVALLTVWDNL